MELGSAKQKKKLIAGPARKGKTKSIPAEGNPQLRLEALRKLLAKRTLELASAKKSLRLKDTEKAKRKGELIIANRKFAFENKEKEKRAAELVIANIELVFQNNEKGKRAAELIIANGELVYQNGEKEKRAAELIIANVELVFQNNEKGKRAAELFVANGELVFQNEEKEKRAAELLNANSQLEAFNYVSSHDLQEPLRKIQMFVLRILETEQEQLSEQGKHCFSRIQMAVVRMRQLIRDLLAFSHLSVAERVLENTDLNKIVEDVKAELKETIEEQGATIDATELCEIPLIRFQFHQLMHNLFSNSLKFSKAGLATHIIITTRLGKGSVLNPGTDEFPAGKLLADTEYCLIRFSDNGIGFDAQYKDRIFEVFQRLHGKDQYAGTGIGLAIVKKIVENHNGVITVSSVLGQGTTFNVYLPMAQHEPKRPDFNE